MRLMRSSPVSNARSLQDELSKVQALISKLKDILSSPKKILAVVKKELEELMEKYGDDRRTRIVKGGVQNISLEDLVPDEDSMLLLTQEAAAAIPHSIQMNTEPKAWWRGRRRHRNQGEGRYRDAFPRDKRTQRFALLHRFRQKRIRSRCTNCPRVSVRRRGRAS